MSESFTFFSRFSLSLSSLSPSLPSLSPPLSPYLFPLYPHLSPAPFLIVPICYDFCSLLGEHLWNLLHAVGLR